MLLGGVFGGCVFFFRFVHGRFVTSLWVNHTISVGISWSGL